MSRIGKQPIALPNGVQAAVADNIVTCKGPKGEVAIAIHETQSVAVNGNVLHVTRKDEQKVSRAMHGTTRALLENAVTGVIDGYNKQLEIQGVGYRVQLQGNRLVFNIGFCHTVEYDAPEGISFACPDQTHVTVSGVDKQQVGQVASELRSIRKPEPYKGKGIRYVGEIVRRKAGKSAKK
jgi:large subunit ribosomal protein L6